MKLSFSKAWKASELKMWFELEDILTGKLDNIAQRFNKKHLIRVSRNVLESGQVSLQADDYLIDNDLIDKLVAVTLEDVQYDMLKAMWDEGSYSTVFRETIEFMAQLLELSETPSTVQSLEKLYSDWPYGMVDTVEELFPAENTTSEDTDEN